MQPEKDWLVKHFENVVDWNADPCDDFYKFTCGRGPVKSDAYWEVRPKASDLDAELLE